MVRNIGVIVQAHMGSTRLPGKVLRKIADKTVLGHDLCRLKKIKNVDTIIVATSCDEQDDLIIEECEKYNVCTYRGSDEDVLSRFYEAAQEYNLTDIVRICSDNPLLDWEIIDKEIELYLFNEYDIVKSGANIPLGLGGEIFSFSKLADACLNARKGYQREHVTPYIYENSLLMGLYDIKDDFSGYRFTLDTNDDWTLIKCLYRYLYKGEHDFLLSDVVKIMKSNPELYSINSHIKQKKVSEL